jgi:2,3-dihydroxybenzoate-AMP ligase
VTDIVTWPAEFAERYRAAKYWRGVTLGGQLRDWATTWGDKTAVVCGRRRLSYRELDERVDRLAAGLRALGLDPGDRVVVQLPNVAEFLTLSFALFRLGATPVYALPAHRYHELRHLCEFSAARAYVIGPPSAGFDYGPSATRLRAEIPSLTHVLTTDDDSEVFTRLSDVDCEPEPLAPRDPADVALFLLSGGTTGAPKLIPRTHDDYVYNLSRAAEVSGLDETSVYLAALPVGHNFPLGCPGVFGTLAVGGTVVMAGGPNPPEAFPLIERERVTITSLVPPLAMLWTEAAAWVRRDLSSLRVLQVGGAKFTPEAARRVRPALGATLQQVFGMAEGLLCYTRLDDPEETVLTTQGRPMCQDDEIRVVDDNGDPVRPGEVGQLLTRGPYTLRGYFRAPEHNPTAFTEDGFYRTGDLVAETPTGHLVVEGRSKDVINRGGEKVSAEEVENHLLAHPDVRDVAVVGLPDPVMGERTCACLIAREPAPTLAELTGFLTDRGLAGYKLPDRLEVLETFPRTAVGKVSKKELVERFGRRS